MADNFDFEKEKRSGNGIDLSSFDLTPFKEYFEEEDAQKAAEEKARLEKLAMEEAKRQAAIRAEREARLREKERQERLAAEKEAKLRAEREKEEARRAAEKEAEAVLAAQKARAAAERLNAEISAESKSSSKEEKAESLEGFSSILSLENTESEEEKSKDKVELTDEFFNYVPDMPSPSNTRHSIICAVLIIAFLVSCAFSCYTYFFSGKDKAEISNTEYIGSSPDFAPYSALKANYPAASFPQGMEDDLKAAYSLNSNTVGWLSIEGTPVDFPIVQYKDNYRYLNAYNFYNKGARYGTPFMDFRCNAAKLSKNTVIYSHHMNNKLFFGSLDRYENPGYYKEHPYIKYETLYGERIFKVYAVFYATTQANADGGFVFDYYNPKMSDNNFKGYIELLNQYALYTTDAGLEATDKIITLSTCTHVYDDLRKGGVDSRFVVVGRLLREGEKVGSGNKSTEENNDYRRPQIWYDKNERINPYIEYRSWKASAK